MHFSQSLTEIIKTRCSKRDYLNKNLDSVLIHKIEKLLSSIHSGPLGNTIHFKLIEKKDAQAKQKVKLGTYGFISGARYFIAGSIDSTRPYVLEDYGYLLEQIILHLTDLGLGTCWLGGTFKRKDFAIVLGNNPNEIIPAITPVGEPQKTKSIRDNIIRWGAKSNSRKPWNELFYDESFEKPLTVENCNDFQTPLEMLRLAPSASNKQPWRIVKSYDSFHFYLLETPGYSNTIKAVKLQQIDMGIAMAHFDLSCKELKMEGKWQISEPKIESEKAKYLATWKQI